MSDDVLPTPNPADPPGRWYQFRLSNVILVLVAFNICLVVYFVMKYRVDEAERKAGERGLAIPDGRAELWIIQRQSLPVPGSGSQLTLTLGDITGGHVMVRLTDKDEKLLTPAQSMTRNDTLEFVFASYRYELRLREFELHLLHDDRARFTIQERGRAP